MNRSVILIGEFSVKPGNLEDLKALVEEMVEATHANEPDTLIFEVFISTDGKSCQIMERYVDSAAAMTHLGNFGKIIGDRLWAFLEPTAFKLCGNPSDELRAAVSGVGAMILTPMGGFAR